MQAFEEMFREEYTGKWYSPRKDQDTKFHVGDIVKVLEPWGFNLWSPPQKARVGETGIVVGYRYYNQMRSVYQIVFKDGVRMRMDSHYIEKAEGDPNDYPGWEKFVRPENYSAQITPIDKQIEENILRLAVEYGFRRVEKQIAGRQTYRSGFTGAIKRQQLNQTSIGEYRNADTYLNKITDKYAREDIERCIIHEWGGVIRIVRKTVVDIEDGHELTMRSLYMTALNRKQPRWMAPKAFLKAFSNDSIWRSIGDTMNYISPPGERDEIGFGILNI